MAKAEAAELKAESARDASSYERAWRDAGRLWERAAERETDAKRRATYQSNAERARATADAPPPETEVGSDVAADAAALDPDPDAN